MSDEVEQLKAALVAAYNHLDIEALRISHCKDAALIEAALVLPPPAQSWPKLTKRMEYAAQDEFHILPPRLARLWARMAELHKGPRAPQSLSDDAALALPAGVTPTLFAQVFEQARAGSDRPAGILRGVRAVMRWMPVPNPAQEHPETQALLRRFALALEVVDGAWRESDPNLRKDVAAWLANAQSAQAVQGAQAAQVKDTPA